jgi:hypothetical protein
MDSSSLNLTSNLHNNDNHKGEPINQIEPTHLGSSPFSLIDYVCFVCLACCFPLFVNATQRRIEDVEKTRRNPEAQSREDRGAAST